MKMKHAGKFPGTQFMAMLFFLVALFAFVNAGAQTEKTDSIKQILAAQNAYRSELGLPALMWSPFLASYAQKWADELVTNRDCRLEHRPWYGDTLWNNQGLGENIYAAGGTYTVPTVLDAVADWGEEKNDFDFETKSCKPGGICGHYTQMIWKNTKYVGCAIVTCPNGMVIVVCNYYPMGNMKGEIPY